MWASFQVTGCTRALELWLLRSRRASAEVWLYAYYGAAFPIGRKACETIDVAEVLSAGGAQRRLIATQRVLALERRQKREEEESQSNADVLAAETAEAEQEWRQRKAEALEARQAANAGISVVYYSNR